MITIYVAEDPGGDLYLIHGSIDSSAKTGRREFADAAKRLLESSPKDELTARELTLYEFDEVASSAFLRGDHGDAFGEYGKVTYEYPGDFVVRLYEDVIS